MRLRALPVCRGYTLGPAYVAPDGRSMIGVYQAPEPVVLVAPYPDKLMLDLLRPAHVRGVVVERGSVVDPLFDRLREKHLPSVVGASGATAAIRRGDLVAIDAAEGWVVVNPDPDTRARYEELRGTAPPDDDPPLVYEAVARLAGCVREAWLLQGRAPPFDLREQGRLFEIARKVALRGERPTADDDAFVAALLGGGR